MKKSHSKRSNDCDCLIDRMEKFICIGLCIVITKEGAGKKTCIADGIMFWLPYEHTDMYGQVSANNSKKYTGVVIMNSTKLQ